MDALEITMLVIWSIILLFCACCIYGVIEAEIKDRRRKREWQEWADKKRGKK